MPPTTSDSRQLKQEIDTLIAAKQSLHTELRNAPPSQKPFFVNLIRDINQELYGKQDEFRRFLEDHSVEDLRALTAAFTAEFDGTVVIEIDHSNNGIRGPHEVEFTPEDDTPTLQLQFDQTSVEVGELTPIETEPHETPGGTNTTTVTRMINEGRTTGSFDEETGHVELPLDLFFDNSVDVPLVEEDAPVDFDLTTKGISAPVGNYEEVDLGGAPLNSETMEFKVVGESVFEDISGPVSTSILGGRNVVLSAEGKLSNVSNPPLDVPSSVSFGQVSIGSVRTKLVSIKNTTGSGVMITIPNSPEPPSGPGAPGVPTFSWTPSGTRFVRQGDKMNVIVNFAPDAVERAQTTLTITATDAGSPHSITLRGRGVGGGDDGGDHPF